MESDVTTALRGTDIALKSAQIAAVIVGLGAAGVFGRVPPDVDEPVQAATSSQIDPARKDAGDSERTSSRCEKPALEFPHPIITEILYAVPSGSAGDANRDGERSSNGDEFVEIYNPHDRPIQLSGYMLTDHTQGAGRFRFVFPKFELPGKSVAVVFNGYQAKFKSGAGEMIGDEQNAPSGPNTAFAGAYIFTAKADKAGIAFANEADCVLLTSPGGVLLQRVWWGSKDKLALDAAKPLLDDQAPTVIGSSVQRPSCGMDATFADHKTFAGESADRLMSPGRFEPREQNPQHVPTKREKPKASGNDPQNPPREEAEKGTQK